MITFHEDDLLKSDCHIICHQVNEHGVMGGGLAKQIAEKYPKAEDDYANGCTTYRNKKELLGKVVFSFIDEDTPIIANCFSQYNQETQYEALCACAYQVRDYAWKLWKKTGYRIRVGIPAKYGCGLAHGDWDKVLNIWKYFFELEGRTELQIWEYDIWTGKLF